MKLLASVTATAVLGCTAPYLLTDFGAASAYVLGAAQMLLVVLVYNLFAKRSSATPRASASWNTKETPIKLSPIEPVSPPPESQPETSEQPNTPSSSKRPTPEDAAETESSKRQRAE